MKTHYLLPSFALVLLLSFSAIAAEGIDSDQNSDLPLNARGVAVAKLKGTYGQPASGVLEVAGLLDAKGQIIASNLITASAGAKIGAVGNNADTACAPDQEGIMRYNTASRDMQYCNGNLWRASAGGNSVSYRTVCECTARNCTCSPGPCASGDAELIGPQCVTTSHVYQGSYGYFWARTCERWCSH